ncbi:MAG: sortase [Patescibacteria group bacterium]
MKRIVLIFIITFILTAILLNIGSLYRWADYYLRGDQTEEVGPTPTPQITNSASLMDDKATLKIPSLNISAPIVFSKSKKEVDLQKDLEKGVALYPGSVSPGENGTMVIIGHSSSYPWYKGNYGSIFSLLEKLKAGDKITIIYNNKNYEYIVKDQIKAASQSIQFLQMQNSDLVLMSCWPVGTNSIRIAVSADLKR